jgi:hypothetical protein
MAEYAPYPRRLRGWGLPFATSCQAGRWFTEFSYPANLVALGGRTRWRSPARPRRIVVVGLVQPLLHESGITKGLDPSSAAAGSRVGDAPGSLASQAQAFTSCSPRR